MFVLLVEVVAAVAAAVVVVAAVVVLVLLLQPILSLPSLLLQLRLSVYLSITQLSSKQAAN